MTLDSLLAFVGPESPQVRSRVDVRGDHISRRLRACISSQRPPVCDDSSVRINDARLQESGGSGPTSAAAGPRPAPADVHRRRLETPRGALRRHRAAARPGLGTIPLLLVTPSRAGRVGVRRLHVRLAACFRRGPYRRGRRHGAIHAAEGQAAAGHRIFLFAGSFDDRLRAGARHRLRGDGGQAAVACVAESRGRHRSKRVGDVPLGDRNTQSPGAAGYPARLATGQDGQAQPCPPGRAARPARLHQPSARRTTAEGHQSQLADVSGRRAVRTGIRYGIGSRLAGDDCRRFGRQSSDRRRALAADPFRGGDVGDGYHRRRADVEGVRLGLRQSTAQDLLQHHASPACRSRWR